MIPAGSRPARSRAASGAGYRPPRPAFDRVLRPNRCGEHVEQPFAERGVVALILLEIAREPRDGGPDHRQAHQPPPDEVAVAIEKGFFLTVDKGRGTWMHRDRGILVGIRGFYFGR